MGDVTAFEPKTNEQPQEPPLTTSALQVLWMLVRPQSEVMLNVPVGQMDAATDAIKQLRAWAQWKIDGVLKAQSQG